MVDKPTWRYVLLALLGGLFVWLGRPRRRPEAPAPGRELVPAQAAGGGPGPVGSR